MLPAKPDLAIPHTDHISHQAQRDPDEEGDYMAFEQLMAEAAAKKGKDDKKKEPNAKKATDKEKDHHHHFGAGSKETKDRSDSSHNPSRPKNKHDIPYSRDANSEYQRRRSDSERDPTKQYPHTPFDS